MNFLILLDSARTSPGVRDAFDAAIKATCPIWWHYMAGAWIVANPEGAGCAALCGRLQSIASRGGAHFLIFELPSSIEVRGVIPSAGWPWLRERFSQGPEESPAP